MVAAIQTGAAETGEGCGAGRGHQRAIEVDAMVCGDVTAVEAATNPRHGDCVGHDAARDIDPILTTAHAQRGGADEDQICGRTSQSTCDVEAIVAPRSRPPRNIISENYRRRHRRSNKHAVVLHRGAASGDVGELECAAAHCEVAGKVYAVVANPTSSPCTV